MQDKEKAEADFLQPDKGRNPPFIVIEPPTTEHADDPSDVQRPGAGRPVSGRVTSLNIFQHPDAHPVVLDMLLSQKYGSEWLVWEPETIELHVQRDFRCTLSHLSLSKIQAMRTMHLVDAFWERWEVFIWCAMPISDIVPDFEIMQVPTVLQCMRAVDIANRVRTDVSWSDELKAYLAAVHRHDEVLVPQPPLDFVKLDMQGYPVNLDEVQDRWPVVRAKRSAPVGDTPEDEQLRRMLALHVLLDEEQDRLRVQLKEVLNA